MKLVGMDVLYFSAYGDFSLSVHVAHTTVQTQYLCGLRQTEIQ